MRAFTNRLRANARLRFAVLGAVALLLTGTTGIIAATLNQNGPFTGCLDIKQGEIYNVAQSATTPLAPCKKHDTLVTFSNARGTRGAKVRPDPPVLSARPVLTRPSRVRPDPPDPPDLSARPVLPGRRVPPAPRVVLAPLRSPQSRPATA